MAFYSAVTKGGASTATAARWATSATPGAMCWCFSVPPAVWMSIFSVKHSTLHWINLNHNETGTSDYRTVSPIAEHLDFGCGAVEENHFERCWKWNKAKYWNEKTIENVVHPGGTRWDAPRTHCTRKSCHRLHRDLPVQVPVRWWFRHLGLWWCHLRSFQKPCHGHRCRSSRSAKKAIGDVLKHVETMKHGDTHFLKFWFWSEDSDS